MIRIELPVILSKLNAQSKLALEQAASLCMSRRNSEVTFEHFLLSVLDNPLSDIRVILKQSGLELAPVKQAITEALSRSESLDNYPSFSPLLIELFQDAWLLSSMELSQHDIRSGSMFLAALIHADRYMPTALISLFSGINRETLRKHFVAMTKESAETPVATTLSKQIPITDIATTALGRFCTNITAMAKNNELDPVLCREDEINLMIDILCRRRKNNPIVVGEAGVGKSAIIEGLAQRIVAGMVPERLKEVDVMSLDLGLLQAGASVKGEFEKRLKAIIDEIKTSPVPIILFIDEAHTLIGAGNQEGSGDAANLLKPVLARGELRTVAATTWKEYKKYIEKDPALTRRFQLIKLDEPSPEQAVTILRGLHGVYEKSHNVIIHSNALSAAAHLSARYMSGRQLPDKAIDVLDTACARVAINLSSPPRQLASLDSRRHQRQLEMKLLQRQQQLGQMVDMSRLDELSQEEVTEQQQYDELYAAWEQQKALVEQIIDIRQHILNPQTTDLDQGSSELALDEVLRLEQVLENGDLQEQLGVLYQQLDELTSQRCLIQPEVNAEQIALVISDWTGVPIDQMNSDELYRLTNLPDLLEQSIKGQSHAIRQIHKHLLTARADLRRSGRPKGAFLLVGPSGVGKTETVVQIAEQLYGGKQFMTTINMSEYQEKHTVSRLIGSPPGYVGYGEGGVLTEAIRKMPYSVVLLDEVEKAHPDVLNLFYQAFDKGEIADGEGRIIDCQNIVFFLTSNLGYQTIVEYADTPTLIDEKLYPELANFFRPALLARMEVIPYLPLPMSILATIIASKLSRLQALFVERYKADVDIDPALNEEILKRATRAENGARMLEAIIEGQVLPSLSLALLNKLAAKEEVNVIKLYVEDGQFMSEVS